MDMMGHGLFAGIGAMEPPEQQIVRNIQNLLGPMMMPQMGSDPNGIPKLMSEGPQIIAKIKKREPSMCSDAFKFAAVQFFVQYYTIRMFSLAPMPEAPMNPMGGPPPEPQIDLEALEVFKSDQARDMEHAWKLLTAKFRSDQMALHCKLLMVEIGQRLESSPKLVQALEAINPLSSNTPEQVKVVAFTACPLVGRWKEFIAIGDSLPPEELEKFSMVSQQMPVPDYNILYQIAKEANAQDFDVPAPEDLPWDQYHIKSIRVKFRDLNCEDFKEKQAELLEEIRASDENINWEDVPKPNDIHLKRMGSIYQCVSFAEAPQQLCGLYDPDRMKVRGKTQAVMGPPDVDPMEIQMGTAQINPEDLQILIQEEMWDLVRDEENPNLFKGTYEMHNYTPTKPGEKITDPEKAPLHMYFDLEVTLCTQKEYEVMKHEQGSKPKAKVEEDFETEFDGLTLD